MIFTTRFQLLGWALLITALCPHQGFACPTIGGLVDYNCDERLKIVFTGDSIVYGIGDTERGNVGGYVERVAETLPEVKIDSIGVPGITTSRLLSDYKRNISLRKVRRRVRGADYVFIDLGRNDYWQRYPASAAVRNIRRLARFLEHQIGRFSAGEPLVFLSVLLPTSRPFQEPFINEINRGIQRLSPAKFHLGPRFDRLSPQVLSEDGLHPTSAGYAMVAKKTVRFIKRQAQQTALELRPDSDQDGIYDFFEVWRFGTSPELVDTDGDGFTDAEEIFVFGSDPVIPFIEEPIDNSYSPETIDDLVNSET